MNEQFKLPIDAFGMTSSYLKAGEYWMMNGMECSGMLLKLVNELQAAASQDLLPLMAEAGKPMGPTDDFEAALVGTVRKYSKLMQKVHGAYAGWLRDYVGKAEGMSEKEKLTSTFWTNQLINFLSPGNFFWTNPTAVQKFVRSKGKSIINGFENWLEDIHRGDSLIQIADSSAFKVGENIATTPGQVVFRNKLFELIQYTPKTESAYTTPMVFIQPWINKYYIMDLTEEKSFVSYLLNQGFTVFIVSWKNPTEEMRNVTFDDYMIRGALKAVQVAREICGVEQVHAAGYCIGGTVLASLMAWLNKEPVHDGVFPIKDFTLFASLVDYSSPGELAVYINEESVRMIEELVKKVGYLDKKYLSTAFRLLRANDLIWRYYSHNYLQGEVPPKSEFLFWNGDSTNLPAAMSSFFLREFYLNNKLVKDDELELANRRINLRRIEQPLYVVGAEQDHICPWQETFKITNLVKGPVRYVLSTEGHITGIINPPSPRSKRKYWVDDVRELTDADEWLQGRPGQTGSWWEDWVRWLSNGDTMREHPQMGSSKYCPLEKAPGSYVREQN